MRWPLVLALVVGALLVLGGGFLWLARAESGRLPPGVAIGGLDLGGKSLEQAAALLRRQAGRWARRPIVLVWPGGRAVTSGVELAVRAEIQEALARAERSRGRLSRALARLGFGGTRTIPLRFELGEPATGSFLRTLAWRVNEPASPAGLSWAGERLVVVRPRVGEVVDIPRLTLLLAGLPRSLAVPLRPAAPEVGTAAALEAKARAERLLRTPPAVVYRVRRAELDRRFLRRALGFQPRGRTLAVSLDPDRLERRLRPVFRGYESRPQDARFAIAGFRVRVVPAKAGVELDVERTAREIVARAGEGQIRARFRPLAPRFTTTEAKRLRISELVSEFTTPYRCCAPRVANIQRAAEILDGTIVPAGGVFSLNEALGPRTHERGFVEAPMIAAGRLVDAVGGGVSQVATTFYNAAFFAGLLLLEHTPHEFYISRYPVGREATVSWGGPELVFRNDWPVAVLVKVAASSTSITVRFYSTKLGRRIESETGEPYDFQPARVRTIVDRSLPRGTRRVVQQGGVAGFSVWYTRRVYRGKKLIRSARFTVRYRPEDTIVEIGPPKPKPRPKPKRKPRTETAPVLPPALERR